MDFSFSQKEMYKVVSYLISVLFIEIVNQKFGLVYNLNMLVFWQPT